MQELHVHKEYLAPLIGLDRELARTMFAYAETEYCKPKTFIARTLSVESISENTVRLGAVEDIKLAICAPKKSGHLQLFVASNNATAYLSPGRIRALPSSIHRDTMIIRAPGFRDDKFFCIKEQAFNILFKPAL